MREAGESKAAIFLGLDLFAFNLFNGFMSYISTELQTAHELASQLTIPFHRWEIKKKNWRD